MTTNWKTRLLDGYKAFRAGDYTEQKALYEKLGTKGQSPNVMLIACSDSRVDPTDIFNAYPGEMFVVRNVANIVPPVDENDSFTERHRPLNMRSMSSKWTSLLSWATKVAAEFRAAWTVWGMTLMQVMWAVGYPS